MAIQIKTPTSVIENQGSRDLWEDRGKKEKKVEKSLQYNTFGGVMSWRGENGAQVEKIREWRIYQLVNILFFFTCIISIFPNLDYKRAFCLASETGNEGRGRTWHRYC